MLVSVVICSTGKSQYLLESINSIRSQSYTNFEIILVDNGIPLHIREEIENLNDNRINIINCIFRQLNFALNLGISHALGNFIFRMDDDDLSHPSRIEKTLDYFNKNPDVDIVGTQGVIIDSNGAHVETTNLPEKPEDIKNKIGFSHCLIHPSICFKKSVLIELGGYQGGMYAQDLELWLRCVRDKERAYKIANIHEPLIYYRVHDNQSKGNLVSYANAAGYLLREFLITKRIKILASCFYKSLKAFGSKRS